MTSLEIISAQYNRASSPPLSDEDRIVLNFIETANQRAEERRSSANETGDQNFPMP